MAGRTVNCVKLGKELPGLEKPPFPGALGKKIFENVSADAWSIWRNDMQMKVLNEYRLNMGNPKDYAVLQEQMQLFLNLKQGAAVEVENAARGRAEHQHAHGHSHDHSHDDDEGCGSGGCGSGGCCN